MQTRTGTGTLSCAPALALLGALTLGGCGGGGGGGGTTTMPGTATLSLSTPTIAFGAKPSGVMTSALTVTVDSTGTAALDVTSVTITGTNAAAFAETNNCGTVAAGSSCTVSVTFTPAQGSDTATLNIASNAAGSPATVALTGSAAGASTTSVAAVIDQGPDPGVNDTGNPTINVLYVTIKLCKPGTQTCQTIDHIQVDTGSTGLRILAAALGQGLNTTDLPQVLASTGGALVECTQFADGYSFGTVKQADMTIGTQTVSSLSVQVIADPSYPPTLANAACKSNNPNEEDTIASFGANGIIGVSYFLADCGPVCPSDGSVYNSCTPGSCAGYAATEVEQLQNPVSLFPAGSNNGVEIQLPAVPTSGLSSVAATVVFGVGSDASALPAGTSVMGVSPSSGEFSATYKGRVLAQSIIDSGSNAYFFPNVAPALTLCPSPNASFYCPASDTVLQATVGAGSIPVSFTVSSVNALAITTAAASGVAGTAGSTLPNTFDFGLTFFFGRSTYVGFEGTTLFGTAAPAVAF